jgi:hypothetical protein
MQLNALRGRLDARLNRAAALFSDAAKVVKGRCRHDDVAYLDGLISYAWQAWCRFCRDLIMHSCLGAQTKAGALLPVTAVPATVQRISYLAIRGNKGHATAPLATNAVWRFEPTWGDVAALVRIIPVANPANATQLLTTFGGVTTGPAHLQKVRNACHHLNDQSFAEVKGLQLYYLSSPIRFPAEASFWVDTVTGDFAFIAWLDEMRLIASNAV